MKNEVETADVVAVLRKENENYRLKVEKLQNLLMAEEDRNFELYERALKAETELKKIRKDFGNVDRVRNYLSNLISMKSFDSRHGEFMEKDREKAELEKRIPYAKPAPDREISVITSSGLRMALSDAVCLMAGA